MNEAFFQAVIDAASPTELKYAVVAALRELDRQAQPPADPWASGWGAGQIEAQPSKWEAAARDQAMQVLAPKRYRTEEEANAARLAARIEADPSLGRAIAALEEALVICTDGSDEQAILAKLNLLKEGGASPEKLVEDGIEPAVTQLGDEGVVDFAAVSMERKAARYQWAKEHQLWEFIPLDEETACEAFAKGGPMWLYLDEGGRDAILAMPPQWRPWLIEEVALDSPKAAHEMGRDLMKQEDALDPDNSPQGQAAMRRANEAFGG